MALDFHHGHGSAPSWRVSLAPEATGVPHGEALPFFEKPNPAHWRA